MMSRRLAVILAAGKGTRMKSDKNKVLHEFNGVSMVGHVLRAVNACNVERAVTIIGNDAESVKNNLKGQCEFAMQEEQLGTGHAVKQARDLLLNEEGNTLIIFGDTPLFTEDTLNKLFQFHEQENSKGTVLTAIASDPGDYGRIVRDDSGNVVKIVEVKDADPEEIKIREINTGIFIFDNKLLFEALEKVTNDNAQGEYYITDLISILRKEGHAVKGFIMDNFDEAIGVNDRIRLAQVSQLMTQRINRQHMMNGVTIVNPDTTYIEADVSIGQDTIIEPGVVLKGQTRIGKGCFIGAYTEIADSEIADNVAIKHSMLESAKVASGVNIGPYAHLRPGAEIHADVHIGNFVEIKKSIIGPQSKIGHLSYVGDAIIGQNVNIGCDTTFANFDGKYKHKSVVGDNTFIGSGTIIVSPVNIGEKSVIAAGSTITKDVDVESLAIARAQQVNKDRFWNKFNNK